MPPPTTIHSLFTIALALFVLGCTEDTTIVTTGEPTTDAAAGLDCAGNPVADPASFPPAPERDIDRPEDKIVDLTGHNRVEISVRDNVFDERWFRVDPCTEIVFVNNGANAHNVLPAAEGAFARIETEALDQGPQTLVVAAPGDYPFYCSIHGTTSRGQTGYLVVGQG